MHADDDDAPPDPQLSAMVAAVVVVRCVCEPESNPGTRASPRGANAGVARADALVPRDRER